MTLRPLLLPPADACVHARLAHTGTITGVVSDGTWVATSGADGRLVVGSRAGVKVAETHTHEGGVMGLAAVGVDRLATIGHDRRLAFHDWNLGLIAGIALPLDPIGLGVAVDGSEVFVSGGVAGLWSWSAATGLRRRTSAEVAVGAIAATPRGMVFLHGLSLVRLAADDSLTTLWAFDENTLSGPETAELRLEGLLEVGDVGIEVAICGDIHTRRELWRHEIESGLTAKLPAPVPHSRPWEVRGIVVTARCAILGEARRCLTGDAEGWLREWNLAEVAPPADVGAFPGNAGTVAGELITWSARWGVTRRWSLVDGSLVSETAGVGHGGAQAVVRPGGNLVVVEAAGDTVPPANRRRFPVRRYGRNGEVTREWSGGFSPVITEDGLSVTWGVRQGWLGASDAAAGTMRWVRTPLDGVGPAVVCGELWVAGSRDGGLVGMDAATGEVRWRTENEGVCAVAVRQDGTLGALVGGDGKAQWLERIDSATGAVLERAALPTPVFASGLVFSGGRVVTSSTPSVVWDGGHEPRLVARSAGLWAVVAAPDGRWLLAIDFERRVRILDVDTGETLDTGVVCANDPCATFAPGKAAFATASGGVALVGPGIPTRSFEVGAPVLGLASGGEGVLGAFADGTLRSWNLTTGAAAIFPGFTEAVWWLGFMGNNRAAAYGAGPTEGWRQYDLAGNTVTEITAPVATGSPTSGAPVWLRMSEVVVRETVEVDAEAAAPTSAVLPSSGGGVRKGRRGAATPCGDVVLTDPTTGAELARWACGERIREVTVPAPDRVAVIDAFGRLTILAIEPG